MARRDGYSRGLESLEEIRASDRFIEQLRVSGTYEPSTRTDAALAAALLTWRDEARLDPLNPPPSADEVDIDVYAQPRRIARRAVAVAAAMLALSSAAATALDGDPLKPVRFLVDLGVNVGERIGHPSSDPSSAEGVDTPTITSSDGGGTGPGSVPILPQLQDKLSQLQIDVTPGLPDPAVSPSAPVAGTEPPPSVTATDEPSAGDGTETTPPPVTETTPPPDSATETTPPDDGQGETTPPTGDPGETTPPPENGNDNPSDPQGGVVDGGLDGGGPPSDSTTGGDENGTNSGDTSNDANAPPPVTSPDNPPANLPGPENQGDQNGGNGQGNGDENGNGDQANSGEGNGSAQDSLDFHGTWPLTGIDPYGLVPLDQPGNSAKSHGNGHAYGHFFKQLNKHERTALKQYKQLNKHEIAAFKKHLDKRERALFNRYLRQFGYTGAAWDGLGHGSVRWRSS